MRIWQCAGSEQQCVGCGDSVRTVGLGNGRFYGVSVSKRAVGAVDGRSRGGPFGRLWSRKEHDASRGVSRPKEATPEWELSTFPVFVNLRDHYGQTDPSEIIHRHARNVGFEKPSHLVRAWRAGFVHLLLDGFDEITALSIQGFWRKLKDNRYRAMAGVRRLIDEHPEPTDTKKGPGLLVTGRAHFFDSPNERRTALGLPVDSVELSLNEFTERQISEYLATTSLSGFVPEWLPSRPLLVGYLAATRVLEDLTVKGSGGELDPVAGWDILLDRVSEREARIEAGIDGGTVRRILERLATKARDSQGGLGPLKQESVVEAFSGHMRLWTGRPRDGALAEASWSWSISR